MICNIYQEIRIVSVWPRVVTLIEVRKAPSSAKFRPRYLKINPVIKSAASADYPMTKMQGGPTRHPHVEPSSVGSPAFWSSERLR